MATMARRTFAKRLKAMRIAAGYETAKTFADALDMQSGTYGKYERAEAEPSFECLLLICDLLRTTPDFLLAGKVSLKG